MYIEELKEGAEVGAVDNRVDSERDESIVCRTGNENVVKVDVRRVLVGAGARVLFYPTLLYNVVRNKIQTEFRWWDRVGEFILLGAVPFPSDVPCLKELGVSGVVTLNEPYETLVPTTLFHAHGINHLVIPTRDYCFAPSLHDICQAVDFIHNNASRQQTTYVHCKAGRGRSTTVVLCYLVKYKEMMPKDAYDYVKSIRPRVLLASSQWQTVQEFYHLVVKRSGVYSQLSGLFMKSPVVTVPQDQVPFDDGSVVLVTKADLVGYDPCLEPSNVRSDIWADLRVVYRVRLAGQAALARISCMWFRYHAHQDISTKNLIGEGSCAIGTDLQGISVDIQVY